MVGERNGGRQFILSCLRTVAKYAYQLRHVRLFVCPHVLARAPTRPISVKFDVGNECENLSRKSKFGYNRTKNSGQFR